jgi:O-acetyl-ADP-ribose deacetylase (regulator of RNase III)
MKIGKTRIETTGTDLSAVDTEAVINPANDMLWMGGGVSSQIRKAGGPVIEEEALKLAPASVGDAVITGAGNLKARWVIHAVISGQDLTATESAIRKAARSAMESAARIGAKSLAIPLLTTGIHDVEIHIDAATIVDVVVDFLVNEPHKIERLVFTASDEVARSVISDTLMEKFTRHG